jgi:hypothetical protein
MSKRKIGVFSVLALVAAGGFLILPAGGQAPPQAAQPANPFIDKVVYVHSKNVMTTLNQIDMKIIAGRVFLVGREVVGYNVTKETFPKMLVWIPVEEIIEMVELEKQKE